MASIRPGCKQYIQCKNIYIYIYTQNIKKSLKYLFTIYTKFNERSLKLSHKILHNSFIENKYWNLYSTKVGENNKKARKEMCIRGADVRFHKYWKSSCVMISKFGSLTVRLKMRKSSFHNPLHNTTLSFHSLAPNMRLFWDQLWLFFSAVALI